MKAIASCTFFCNNLNEENKTFKFEKRHVLATPVPSSVKASSPFGRGEGVEEFS